MNMKETCSKLMSCDAGLFLMRLALGLPFVAHGWQKLSGMESVVGFFGTLGVPSWLAWLVALVEFFGGLAVLLGIGLKWASWLLAAVMFFAILLVKGKMGFLGGYELDLTFFLLALGLSFSGAGKCSLMVKMGKKDVCASCADGVCKMHK